MMDARKRKERQSLDVVVGALKAHLYEYALKNGPIKTQGYIDAMQDFFKTVEDILLIS